MDNSWIGAIEYKVFAFIQKDILNQFPKATISTSSEIKPDPNNLSKAIFPSIYVHMQQPSERDEDLEMDFINQAEFPFQIEVYSKDRLQATNISMAIANTMKKHMFKAVGIPFTQEEFGGINRNVSRYQRVISYNDIL